VTTVRCRTVSRLPVRYNSRCRRPDGGTVDKPVGTVHLSIVTPSGRLHRELYLTGSRDTVRQRTVVTALHELRLLVGQPYQSWDVGDNGSPEGGDGPQFGEGAVATDQGQ
jgi:hypothetical protein